MLLRSPFSFCGDGDDATDSDGDDWARSRFELPPQPPSFAGDEASPGTLG